MFTLPEDSRVDSSLASPPHNRNMIEVSSHRFLGSSQNICHIYCVIFIEARSKVFDIQFKGHLLSLNWKHKDLEKSVSKNETLCIMTSQYILAYILITGHWYINFVFAVYVLVVYMTESVI